MTETTERPYSSGPPLTEGVKSAEAVYVPPPSNYELHALILKLQAEVAELWVCKKSKEALK